MSPLNKHQLNQIRDERREQIKQAALIRFARHGYLGTKTSMIAAEAGISEGLIFRYFKSKDVLFTTLVQELIEEAKLETENLQYLPGSPFEQIKALTTGMLDESSKYAFMLILRARKTDEIPEEAARILEQHSEDVILERLISIFIQGQEAGEFSPGDPRKLLAWYFSIINCLIMEEVAMEEYGLPNADYLMRFLKT
ncbi:TetR/AcrR family transcriptional regulator [Paenibacillus mendelii]|uniref:TetR/AcrR family transcriptional regulator n=1 Tax=Paenibacillus mendelii TaxID=206163 RepID=A0ABV6JDQ5_9BACL|nr:TetR/AcrR family transcriptional regulator [Paenibacillus mendelii]MCQ6563808.1 TetR/AcrR family transcriptional regulator [Paenibacillus mendelii]